jgi:hypothetical protein
MWMSISVLCRELGTLERGDDGVGYDQFSLPEAANGIAPAIGLGEDQGFQVWDGSVHDAQVKTVLESILGKMAGNLATESTLSDAKTLLTTISGQDFATETTLVALINMLGSILSTLATANQIDALMGMTATSGQLIGIASQIGDVCVLLDKLHPGASSFAAGVLDVGDTPVELKVGESPLNKRIRLRLYCEGNAPIYIVKVDGTVETGFPIKPGSVEIFNERHDLYVPKYAVAVTTQKVRIIEEGK